MVQINWTLQAKKDLKEIAEYISRDSKIYAKRQVLKIRNRTFILRSQPQSGRIVPELQEEIIRELLEGNYRLVSNNRIDILTIHHSARDLLGGE